MEDIYEKVLKYAESEEMFSSIRAVLAGVSGGGDSMAMLDLLCRLRERYDFLLRVVHVNHGIRGDEALRDQRLVEKICSELGIPCSVYCYDVPALARNWGTGHEEAGRMARKAAFSEERKLLVRMGLSGREIVTALAHNKNDLAETMLHHLARGTGIRGLSSMKPLSGEVIRPLLCLERREIDKYLNIRHIPYVTDYTNLSDDYTRNRIRHHVLPVMEQEINTKAVCHMAETSVLLGMAEEYLKEQGRALLDTAEKDGEFLFRSDFFGQKEILKMYAVREALEVLSGRKKDLSLLHVRNVLVLLGGRTGARIPLPYGLEAVRVYEGILLRRREEENRGVNVPGEEVELPFSGILDCPYGSFHTRIFSYSGQKILEKKYTKWMDCDKIKYGLTVRTRKNGDYLVINREGNRKKLTRCMIDDKIPAEDRGQIPLIASGQEIVWIVGGRMSESCKITSETRRVLQIEYQGK